MSYGNGSDLETFAKDNDIINSDDNDLIEKANVLESFENLIISV